MSSPCTQNASKFVPNGYIRKYTPPTGDCLFHALYYAVYPEQGYERAKTKSAQQHIRKLIADNARSDINFIGFALEDAFASRAHPKLQQWLSVLTPINSKVFAGQQVTPTEQQNRLTIFREAVQSSPNYWGGALEIDILNSYLNTMGLPKICVWDQCTGGWLPPHTPLPTDRIGIDYRPILKTTGPHFEILEPTSTSSVTATATVPQGLGAGSGPATFVGATTTSAATPSAKTKPAASKISAAEWLSTYAGLSKPQIKSIIKKIREPKVSLSLRNFVQSILNNSTNLKNQLDTLQASIISLGINNIKVKQAGGKTRRHRKARKANTRRRR